jgi:hypothetical protein
MSFRVPLRGVQRVYFVGWGGFTTPSNKINSLRSAEGVEQSKGLQGHAIGRGIFEQTDLDRYEHLS